MTTTQELDEVRLMVAAHELGHAIVWTVTGMRVDAIKVTGHGRATEGTVSLADHARLRCTADCHSYLVGMLAGREAEILWCDATNTQPVADGCAQDLREFAYMYRRRRPWGVTESRAALRIQARRLVRVHWRSIVRLTPILARSGHLSPGRLPN